MLALKDVENRSTATATTVTATTATATVTTATIATATATTATLSRFPEMNVYGTVLALKNAEKQRRQEPYTKSFPRNGRVWNSVCTQKCRTSNCLGSTRWNHFYLSLCVA